MKRERENMKPHKLVMESRPPPPHYLHYTVKNNGRKKTELKIMHTLCLCLCLLKGSHDSQCSTYLVRSGLQSRLDGLPRYSPVWSEAQDGRTGRIGLCRTLLESLESGDFPVEGSRV